MIGSENALTSFPIGGYCPQSREDTGLMGVGGRESRLEL